MVTIYSFFFHPAYARVHTVFANFLLKSNLNEKEWSSKNVPNYGRKRDELPWSSFKQRLNITLQGAPSSRQPLSACCSGFCLKCPVIPFQIEPYPMTEHSGYKSRLISSQCGIILMENATKISFGTTEVLFRGILVQLLDLSNLLLSLSLHKPHSLTNIWQPKVYLSGTYENSICN